MKAMKDFFAIFFNCRRPRCSGLFALFALIVTFLPACESVLTDRGNIIQPKDVANIQIGKTTRAEVQAFLGSPSFVNSFQQTRWVYIDDRRFKGSRAVNRLVVVFNPQGVVESLEKNFEDQLLFPGEESSAP